jgi:hypothetical protein
MSYEYSIEYTDVIKAYQTKLNEFMTQLIATEAKVNAATNIIEKLNAENLQLRDENQKLKKSQTRKNKDDIVDFSS